MVEDDTELSNKESPRFKDQVKEFWHYVKTPEFMLFVLFTIINLIRNNFYMTSSNIQLGSAANVLGE